MPKFASAIGLKDSPLSGGIGLAGSKLVIDADMVHLTRVSRQVDWTQETQNTPHYRSLAPRTHLAGSGQLRGGVAAGFQYLGDNTSVTTTVYLDNGMTLAGYVKLASLNVLVSKRSRPHASTPRRASCRFAGMMEGNPAEA